MFETPIAAGASPPSYDALTLTLTRPALLKELADQAQLAHSVFPLGDSRKEDVRREAAARELLDPSED